MEPITAGIVAALAGGATAALNGVASEVVRDAYNALKALLVERYKRKATIEAIEEDPASQAQQQAVAEALQRSGALDDGEVLRIAQGLATALAALPAKEAAAAGLDIERFKAESVHIRNITSPGTAARLKDVRVKGKFIAENIHAGMAPGNAKRNP